MGEALIVAVKRAAPIEADEADASAVYVNLWRRPQSTVDATEIARAIVQRAAHEDGFIRRGDDEIGCHIRASLADGGCASLREPSVAAAARGLARGSLRLPRLPEPFPVPIAVLADLGERGLVDRDISGTEKSQAGVPRGAFDVVRRREGTPTYPMLWAHDAERERRLVVEPDREGRVRPQRDQHALDVWETASRLHFNRDYRLNSQSLAACLTPERSIGGRAWPNFRVDGDARREEALALWANTTLGLIGFWWVAGRQQQGRAILTISELPSLSVLDVRTLDVRVEAWERFCRAWAASLTANAAGALYICMSSREWPVVCRVLAEAGAHWSDTIIWAKDRFTAIIEAPGGPGVMLSGDQSDLYRHCDPRDLRIVDCRLEAALDGALLTRIPSNAELGRRDLDGLYRALPFPSWSLCVRNTHNAHVLYSLPGNGLGCPLCHTPADGRDQKARREAIRYVAACSGGHLDDVSWGSLLSHSCDPTHLLWEGGGRELDRIVLRCPSCNVTANFGDAFKRRHPCTGVVASQAAKSCSPPALSEGSAPPDGLDNYASISGLTDRALAI